MLGLETVKMSDPTAIKDSSSDVSGEKYLGEVVQKQLDKLGDNPSLIEVASVLLRQSAKAENEARKASLKLEQDIAEALKAVQASRLEFNILKDKEEVIHRDCLCK